MPNIWMEKQFENRVFFGRQLFVWVVNALAARGNTVYTYSSSVIPNPFSLPSGNEKLAQTSLLQKEVHGFEGIEPKTVEIISRFTTNREYDIDLTSRAIDHANTVGVDILHDYGGYFPPYFLPFAQMPMVFSLHAGAPEPGTVEHYRINKFKECYFIAASRAHKANYEVVGAKNIFVVYHGVDLNAFPLNIEPQAYMVNIGRFVPEKGIDIAVQAAAKLKRMLKITIEVEPDTEYFHQKVKPYLASECVQKMPILEGEEKSMLLRNAKLFVFPIQWEEPFGMVLIEAMASGTPVVAFARGGVPEIVKDGETGFLVNSSDSDKRGDWITKTTGVDGLCEAIERIYAMSQDRYQEMRYAAHLHVSRYFTIAKMGIEYEKVYQEIIHRFKRAV